MSRHYINEIEPITLYYEHEPNIKNIIKCQKKHDAFPDKFPPTPELLLDEFGVTDETTFQSIINCDAKSKLLKLINRDVIDEKKRNKLIERHKIVSLLYKMRCNIVHEAGKLGSESKIENKSGKTEPYYRKNCRLFVEDGNIVSQNVIELIIPDTYIINLTKNILDEYFAYCEKNNRLPFENNMNFKRKISLSWSNKE